MSTSYPLDATFYLVLGRKMNRYRHPELEARLAVRTPKLAPNEIAVELSIKVPEALFSRPALRASVVVADSAVSAPVINAAVVSNAEQVLRDQLGLDVQLTVVGKGDSE
ncbi:MAG: hypothetical protein EPN60_15115 [Nevskiaceae bacterium]|nr:MAG: hypothetical protein EPN60_15115 [Nevskiaceae bacterium]